MNNEQLKKLEINSNLSFVLANKLDEVGDFIEFILYKNKVKQEESISVRVRHRTASKSFKKLDAINYE